VARADLRSALDCWRAELVSDYSMQSLELLVDGNEDEGLLAIMTSVGRETIAKETRKKKTARRNCLSAAN
jgi:hypothetical protein